MTIAEILEPLHFQAPTLSSKYTSAFCADAPLSSSAPPTSRLPSHTNADCPKCHHLCGKKKPMAVENADHYRHKKNRNHPRAVMWRQSNSADTASPSIQSALVNAWCREGETIKHRFLENGMTRALKKQIKNMSISGPQEGQQRPHDKNNNLPPIFGVWSCDVHKPSHDWSTVISLGVNSKWKNRGILVLISYSTNVWWGLHRMHYCQENMLSDFPFKGCEWSESVVIVESPSTWRRQTPFAGTSIYHFVICLSSRG